MGETDRRTNRRTPDRYAPSTAATMSKQHCRMLQVELIFRQSRMLLRQSRTLLRHRCSCGWGFTLRFPLDATSVTIKHQRLLHQCRDLQHCSIYVAWLRLLENLHVTIKPRPHQQQCRRNIRLCRKNRSTCCSIRQYCLDIVAGVEGA